MAGERMLKVTILGDADKLSNTFRGLGTDLGGFGSKLDDLAGRFPVLSGHVDGLKDKLGGLSTGQLAAIGGVTAVGAAAVVAGKQLYDLGNDFDAAYDKIRVSTGKTGKDLESLEQNFRNVARTVPSSFNDVSSAVAELSTKTGASGTNLEALSRQFLNLSRITGTDVSVNIDTAAKAFQDFGIPVQEAGRHLDYVFSVAQRTGQPFGELLSTVDKFGPGLKGMGISFDDAARMAATLAQRGVDVDKVFGGLTKAFVTGAKDVTKAQEDVAKAQTKYQDAVTSSEEKIADIRERGKEKAQEAAERIRDAEDRLKDVVEANADRKKQAHERYQDAVQSARDKVVDAEQRQRDVAEESAERIKDAKESAAEAAENAADRIKAAEESAAERVESAAERVVGAKERAAERQEDAAQRVREAEEELAKAQTDGATPAQIERLTERVNKARTNQQRVATDAAKDITKAEKDQAKANEDAAKQVDKAKKDGAKSVEDATKRVQDAEENAGKAAGKTAKAVEDAKADEKRTRERAQDDLDRVEKTAQKAVEDAQKAIDKARQDSVKIHDDTIKAEKAAKEEATKARDALAKAEKDLQDATTSTSTLSGITAGKLSELVTAISGAATEEDALATASRLMGTKVSAEFVAMVRDGKLQLSDLKTNPNGGLDATRGAINNTAGAADDGAEKMRTAFNNMKVALEPFANAVFTFASVTMGAFATAITWASDNLPVLGEVILTIVGGPFALMGVAVKTVYDHLGIFRDVVDVVWDKLKAFGGWIKDVFTGNWSDAWRGVKDTFNAVWNGFISFFTDWIPNKFVPKLGEVTTAMFRWVASTALDLPAKLAEWTAAFIAWVGSSAEDAAGLIFKLVTKLAEVTTAVLGWIAGQAEGILTKLGEWTASFIAWVPMAAAALVAEAVEKALDFFTWIGTNALKLPGQLVAWTTQFVSWAGGVGASIATAIGTGAISVVAWIGAQAANIAGQLVHWTSQFTSWLAGLPGDLAGGLAGLASSLAGLILDSFKRAWNAAAHAINSKIPFKDPIPTFDTDGNISGANTGATGNVGAGGTGSGTVVAAPPGATMDPITGQWYLDGKPITLGGDVDPDFDETGPARPGEEHLTANAVKIRREIQGNFSGFTSLGGYAARTTAAGTPSDHATGRAIDVMMPYLHAPLGDRIAQWAIRQPEMKYVIWDNELWSKNHPTWRPYAEAGGAAGRANQGSPTGRHEDHVHISVLGNGGWSRQGGMSIVGDKGPELRYLSPGEGVLPLDHPMARAAMGGSSVPVQVHVHVGGSVVTERDLVLGIRDGLLELQRQGVSLGFT